MTRAQNNPGGMEAVVIRSMAEDFTKQRQEALRAMLDQMIYLAPGRLFRDIQLFHEKYGLAPTSDASHTLDDECLQFRLVCLLEELGEYAAAVGFELSTVQGKICFTKKKDAEFDAHEALDGLADLVYFALGTAYLHGFAKFDEAWARIQAANMAKVRAEKPSDSKRGSTFDVVKPAGWKPADLTDLL
jgi:predicted HAD superfamily Cof-like phosphohydrolase